MNHFIFQLISVLQKFQPSVHVQTNVQLLTWRFLSTQNDIPDCLYVCKRSNATAACKHLSLLIFQDNANDNSVLDELDNYLVIDHQCYDDVCNALQGFFSPGNRLGILSNRLLQAITLGMATQALLEVIAVELNHPCYVG